LAPACWNQPQITEAPVIMILCARTDVLGDNGVIKKYMAKSKKDQNRTDEQIAGFEKYITDTITKLSADELKSWSQKQVYLAGMTMMLAAMEKGLDSCPMEGFVPDQVGKILDLPPHIIPTLIIPIGYKNMEQPIKTRFELADVVKEIK
jgi:nitroreductase